MEYMTDGDINNEISASLASPSTFFPSLERFYLENCPNLKGWWRRDIVVDKGKGGNSDINNTLAFLSASFIF